MSEQTETIAIRLHGKTVDVEGRIVMPGLAITPTTDNRYSITHTPSGRALIQGRCARHIETAAELVVAAAGIDWTRDSKTVGTDETVRVLALNILHEVPYCERRCDNAYDGPSWRVRCDTCRWEWEDEYNEGPLDAKAAKQVAREHECEPEVYLSPPDDDNERFAEWLVNDDGTIGSKVGVR